MATPAIVSVSVIPLSITLGVVGWGLIAKWYVWPRLRDVAARDALVILILPHVFRYLGLTFLIPGVTSVPLNPRFADPSAYGDLLTVVFALASIAALRAESRLAVPLVWIMSVVGLGDLINAFPEGLTLQVPGDFGACIFIALAFVPFLIVSHILIIAKLLQKHESRDAYN